MLMSSLSLLSHIQLEIYQRHRVDFRDWSLIIGRVGATKQKLGSKSSFTPTKKVGGKGFSHAEGGINTF